MKLKFLLSAALAAILILGCNREEKVSAPELSLSYTEVGSTTATVVVENLGGNASMCRFVAAEISRELAKEIPDLSDASAFAAKVRSFIRSSSETEIQTSGLSSVR